MSRGYYLVMTDPAPGAEDEYNDWYARTHMPDSVDNLRGLVSGQRFVRRDMTGVDSPFPRYLAVYEFEAADAELVDQSVQWQRSERADARAHGRKPVIEVSPALDLASMQSGLYVPVGEKYVPR